MHSTQDLASGSRLKEALRRIESFPALDPSAMLYERLSKPISAGRTGTMLRGNWLGHALHPLLTDLALGCWLGAGLLDLFGGKESQRAATTLVGAGLLAAVPTAFSGAAEWPSLMDRSSRRVAVVHATGNLALIICYLTSWLLRRNGKRNAGLAWGMAGGCLGWMTGYLGGHLSFGRGVGHGERWATESQASSRPDETDPGTGG